MTYDEFIIDWNSESDFIVCQTSGSTGKPKLIDLPKEIMRESAERTISFFDLKEGSHFYSCISPDYIGGKMMAVRALLNKGKLSYVTPSNRPLSEYNGEPVDLLAIVPSQMKYLIENNFNFRNISNIIIGGAAVSDILRKEIAKRNINAFETYGMTETASHIALRKISNKTTHFKPLPDIKVKADNENRLVIEIKSSGGFEKKKSVNRVFHTNDLCEVFTDGSFRIKGRYDNIINTGGIKINPEEIEKILEKHLKREVLITSTPHEKWGNQIIMVIDDDDCSISDDSILEICRLHLRKEAVPKTIIHSRIEKTGNGKKKRCFSQP